MSANYASNALIGRRGAVFADAVSASRQVQQRRRMLAYMKRTTLKIPEQLDALLRHEAERRGTTISEINREALEAYLIGSSGRRRLGAAAAGRSGFSDVSERIEEILAAEVERSPR